MKDFMANPYVSRIVGAVGAGLTAYAIPPHDLHGAMIAAVTFLGYGVVHTTTTGAGQS